MLLDETPATLLRHTLQNFTTTPDRAALLRINDSLHTLSDSRAYRLSDSTKHLRTLQRRLATISQQHRETLESHDGGHKHTTEIVELDSKKFRVAKVAQELEIEGERLEGELGRLRGVLGELEGEGVEGGREVRKGREGDDPVVLRLWLYRSLGISLEQDNAGNYNKATISNTKKGDVHVVNIEPGKFSKHFYADYFWSTMQG